MKTIQIIALSNTGVNLIWDENKSDFVSFQNEVPETDIDSLSIAKEKANQYEGIVSVWCEETNWDTGETIVLN